MLPLCVGCGLCRLIWRIITERFRLHPQGTEQLQAQPTTVESTEYRVRRFIECFLDRSELDSHTHPQCHITFFRVRQLLLLYLQRLGLTANALYMRYVVCRSVSDASGWEMKHIKMWLRDSHISCALDNLFGVMRLKGLRVDRAVEALHHMNGFNEDAVDVDTIVNGAMKSVTSLITAAFSRPQQDGIESEDTTSPLEAQDVTTPMELFSLVIYQSQVMKLPAAQQCLQLLYEQLGLSEVDQPILLKWLANVRTYHLQKQTGELEMDINCQWVSPGAYSEPADRSLFGVDGQRLCSDPPALLIPASHDSAGHRSQYHLLQRVDVPEHSPLHSQYTPSLSNLVLSPMLPFIQESAGVNKAGPVYFLPILHIRQPLGYPQTPSPASASTSSGSPSLSKPSWEVRCGEAVRISPRLCTQLGSHPQGPRSRTGQPVESEESSQRMIFFGALLMVGPQVRDKTNKGNAEVWALLADSLGRWWVYRWDLSSPSHLVVLSGAKDGHLRENAESITKWSTLCQHLGSGVLKWMHFTGVRDSVDSRPVMQLASQQQSVEDRRREPPPFVIDRSASPQEEEPRTSAAAGNLSSDVVEGVGAPVPLVQQQRTEEDDEVEQKNSQTPRRSGRKEKKVGWEGLTQQDTKASSRKSREKDKEAANSVRVMGKKVVDTMRRQEEEDRKIEMKRRKEAEKEEKRKLQNDNKNRKRNLKRAKEREMTKRLRTTPPASVEKDHTIEGAEGVRTRSGGTKDAPSTHHQKTPAGSTKGKGGARRKAATNREEETPQDTVVGKDEEKPQAGITSNKSQGARPLTSTPPDTQNLNTAPATGVFSSLTPGIVSKASPSDS